MYGMEGSLTLVALRSFRLDLATTDKLVRVALGLFRRAPVAFGRRARVTLGQFRHSPFAFDRLVRVARRLACADHVVVTHTLPRRSHLNARNVLSRIFMSQRQDGNLTWR